MSITNDSGAFTTVNDRIARSEIDPHSTYGVVPTLDQYDALEVHCAFADGGLQEVPSAYAAYVGFQQRQYL